MQTVADMRVVGVKNSGKFADVLCGQPLKVSQFFCDFVELSLKLKQIPSAILAPKILEKVFAKMKI